MLLALPALSACTVQNAQTDQVYTPADGVNNRDGQIDVLNALIVSDEPGSGRLIAGLSNNNPDEADTLTSVKGAEEDAAVQFTLVEGDTEIAPGGYLNLAGEGAPVVLAEGDEVAAGAFVRLTMAFSNGEAVTVNVPVLAAEGDYAEIEIPTATAPATP